MDRVLDHPVFSRESTRPLEFFAGLAGLGRGYVTLFGDGESFGPAVTAYVVNLWPVELWGILFAACASVQIVGALQDSKPLRTIAAISILGLYSSLAVGFVVRDPWHIATFPTLVVLLVQFHILTRLRVDRGREIARRRRITDV